MNAIHISFLMVVLKRAGVIHQYTYPFIPTHSFIPDLFILKDCKKISRQLNLIVIGHFTLNTDQTGQYEDKQ